MHFHRKMRSTLMQHLMSSLTMLDFFIAPSSNGGSLSSWFSLVSGKEAKTQRTSNHLCNTGATHDFRTCWPISLCPEVWYLITILTDLVCGANGRKIIEFLIRCSHRICLNDFQLQWITQTDHMLHGLFHTCSLLTSQDHPCITVVTRREKIYSNLYNSEQLKHSNIPCLLICSLL